MCHCVPVDTLFVLLYNTSFFRSAVRKYGKNFDKYKQTAGQKLRMRTFREL